MISIPTYIFLQKPNYVNSFLKFTQLATETFYGTILLNYLKGLCDDYGSIHTEHDKDN